MSNSGKPSTVKDALSTATAYWDANEGTRTRSPGLMQARGLRCAEVLGLGRKLSSLSPLDGAKLLVKLKEGGLSRSSVATYYAAGKRMLNLAGLSTVDWPKAPTPPRKTREAVRRKDVMALVDALDEKGHHDTASLVRLMWDTGLRVDVEALRGDWDVRDGMLVVHEGKGGHSRRVPYKGPERGPLRGASYETHLRRMKACGDLLPHDIRRAFVKRVYENSGKDIRVAQVLAGHANPGTTAGYIGVDAGELDKAVRDD